MMVYLYSFLFLILFATSGFSSIKEIENKIDQNKKQIQSVQAQKSSLDRNLANLANRINDEEKEFKQVVDVLENTNNQLLLNKLKLNNAKSTVDKLQKQAQKMEEVKQQTEEEVLEFVIEKYAMSMGVEQLDKESLKDIIAKETYLLIFDNVKDEIMNLNIEYLKVNKSIRENEQKITQLNQFIQEQNEIQKRYEELVEVHEKKLQSLQSKHKQYQKSLQTLIDKQNEITDILGDLNILKKEEIKKEEERIRKEKERQRQAELKRKKAQEEAKRKAELARKKALDGAKEAFSKGAAPATKEPKPTKELTIDRKNLEEDIDIEVRKIGSSAKGIKISRYTGAKTIAPLKSYTVTKKFGKYYDKVYKMELFNESVSLKTKTPNAKVLSIFKGQVVYAKQNSGLLQNVVIVKHSDGLHTIYSHLDKIAPTLKVGKWIPKGYVVGRVSDTLEFQATKNSRYIDPLKLIK